MYSFLICFALCNLLYFALHITGNGTFPKPLSAKEEQQCLERIKQGDTEARNQLIEHNLRLVAHIIKKYYANYKDYYYLPLEDTALHKSIASFVDKDYREQATARNCYTRKISLYLPQWKVMVEPFFKRDYDSKDLFFELTDDIKKDRQLFSDYASHVLNAIAFQD